jgi:osmotically-inducible protein OsmY
LQKSLHPSLRKVHCSSRNGVVTLTGRVPSYYCKQVAQSLAQQSDRVVRVINQLTVGPVSPSKSDQRRAPRLSRTASKAMDKKCSIVARYSADLPQFDVPHFDLLPRRSR